MRNFRLWKFACVVVALHGQVHAQPGAVPFVAGFERFARHQEIDEVVAGRLLLTELNCTACHAATSEPLKPKLGPRLNGVGNRLEHQWIQRFLAAPQKVKPGTTMPDLLVSLPEGDRVAAARALAAFLVPQLEPFPDIKGNGARGVPHEFWSHGDSDQGRLLYHQVGCVACHEPDEDYVTVETKPSPLDQLLEQLDEDELKELGMSAATRRVPSVPQANLAAKYSQQSLTFFLLDPHSTRPAGSMPNLKLDVVEAADIAAWLLRDRQASSDSAPEHDAVGADDVQTGRRLFSELGCANCHSVKDVARGKMAQPLAELDMSAARTCVGTPVSGLPHFELDSSQIAALKSALKGTSEEPATDSTVAARQQLDLQLLKLNCLACHERDGRGGVGRYRRPYFETVGHVDIGDEGRLPPPLTAVGRKLQPGWLTQVLKGTGDVRSHMRIRMPIFPADDVKVIPSLLARADGQQVKPLTEQEVFGDISRLAEAGRLLLDTGCVQCHSVRGEALPGVVGVDLDGVTSRVTPQWFHDFLLDPGKLKPRTRMPTFFPNGKSQNAAILDGDTEKQIAAMWAYLKNAGKLELPPKIQKARSQNYELIPTDRPIVLRTFMEEAGTHAIAIGFPEKVHFTFDAEHVGLASAWRGRFLDAQGTWFVRFAPPADPLGDKQISFPQGVPFVLLNESSRDDDLSGPDFDAKKAGYRFLGYRLDKSGVPTFLYRFGRFDIEDRIKADSEQTLIRQLTIIDRMPQQPSTTLWFRGHFGKSLKYDGPLAYTNDAGVSMTLLSELKHAGELEAREDGTHWIVPVKVERKETIEVRYRW